MSLFLGSDNSLGKILHITSTPHTASEMKGNELSDTVFHSNLNYVRIIKTTGVILDGIMTVTQETRNIIGTNAWIVVSAAGVYIPSIWGQSISSAVVSPEYGKWNGLTIRLGKDPTASGTHDLYPVDATYNGTCKIYVFSVDITNSTFNKIPVTNNEINVRGNSLTVRGFDILNSSYLTANTINSVDDKISVFGKTFQVTNTNIAETTTSLVSNPSFTAIYRGTTPIIHSQYSTSIRYRGSKSIYLPGNPGRYGKYNVVKASVNFDEPLPSHAFIVCSLNALNTFPSDNNSFLFPNSCGEFMIGILSFNILTHWKVSAQVTTTSFILRSYFMVKGSYSILGNTYTIHIFY